MTTWSHPRIANPECRIDATDDIAAEARAAFARRRDTYPQLVQAGRLTADDARDDIEGWRAIAKDWHWVATGEGTPADGTTLDLRTAALDMAIARWFDRHDDRRGSGEAEMEQLALLCAMRIWAKRERTVHPSLHIRAAAAAMHEWRANHGHPTRGAMLATHSSERHAA